MHARGVLLLSVAAVLLPVLLRAQTPQSPPANVGDLIRLAAENNSRAVCLTTAAAGSSRNAAARRN